jgi:hypothetical protein
MSSAYLNAYTSSDAFITNGSDFTFDTVQASSGITAGGTGNTMFTVSAAGKYLVTLAISPSGTVQLQVNGTNVGPQQQVESCQPGFVCDVSLILSLNAADSVTLVNDNGSVETDSSGSSITIMRIA